MYCTVEEQESGALEWMYYSIVTRRMWGNLHRYNKNDKFQYCMKKQNTLSSTVICLHSI